VYYVNFFAGLLVPLALLLVGIAWKIKPPAREDSGLAYRTALSERSQETWDFAHRQISRLWTRLGVILGVLTAALVRFWVKDTFPLLLWVLAGQMIFVCSSAFFVDTLLKASFDEDGRPIQ